MAYLVTGRRAPREWIEFALVDRFKWTLAYVRSLPLIEVLRLLTVMSTEVKVNRSRSRR